LRSRGLWGLDHAPVEIRLSRNDVQTCAREMRDNLSGTFPVAFAGAGGRSDCIDVISVQSGEAVGEQ
jgi:hypothetical protein